MSKLVLGTVAFVAIAGCGGSFPPPSEKLSSAEAASRSARELGAEKEPKAALYLKYANEQIEQAKALIAAGDNRRADEILARAGADAELALQLAKETSTRAEANEALEKLKALKGGK
jgi:type III secretion system FlhB-like substrate exporter